MPKQANFLCLIHHQHWFPTTMQKIPIQTTALRPHYCRTRYSELCALLIFQLLAYCNSVRWRHTNVGYAQVHSIFIYLVQVGDTSNVKATLNNMQEHVAFWCHVCIFNHPSLCIAFWRLLGSETGNYYYLYLDAGVVPYGNSTCDLWPFNMHSLTR